MRPPIVFCSRKLEHVNMCCFVFYQTVELCLGINMGCPRTFLRHAMYIGGFLTQASIFLFIVLGGVHAPPLCVAPLA